MYSLTLHVEDKDTHFTWRYTLTSTNYELLMKAALFASHGLSAIAEFPSFSFAVHLIWRVQQDIYFISIILSYQFRYTLLKVDAKAEHYYHRKTAFTSKTFGKL